MTATRGNNSGNQSNPGPRGRKQSKLAASAVIESAKAIESLLALQHDCFQELNQICERVKHESNQLAAERANKLFEMQVTSYKAQHDAYLEYGMSTCGAKTAPGAEQTLLKGFESVQETVLQAAEEVDRSANAALQDLNESANRDWDKVCGDFLVSLKDDLGKLDEHTASPDLLATMGQSLICISSYIRKQGTDTQS